jgi:hypothetical protein
MESDPPATLSKIAKVLAEQKYRDMLVKASALDKSIETSGSHVYPSISERCFHSSI